MRVGWLVLVIATGGCDKLFGINELPLPGDAAPADASPFGYPCFDGTFETNMIDSVIFNTIMDPGVTVQAAAKQLTITPATNQPGSLYGILETQSTYDITDGMVAAEIFAIPGENAEGELSFYVGTDGAKRYGISVTTGKTEFFYYNDTASPQIVDSIVSETVPHFLRIYNRSSNNEIVYGISTDAITWLEFPTPVLFDLTKVIAEIDGGSYAPAPSPGHATFDNFQLLTHSCFH